MAWSVYILECGDKSLYTGITNNVKKRFVAHSSGRGARYTRAHLPVKLIYHEKVGEQSAAMRRELDIKKWPKNKKLALAKTRKVKSPKTFEIQKLKNLGPKSSLWLESVGIVSERDLRKTGALKAFRRVSKLGVSASLNLLYALEGALQNRHWASFSKEERMAMDLSVAKYRFKKTTKRS